MNNDEQLKDLGRKAEKLQEAFTDEPATKAEIVEIATVLGDLIDIVHAHIYRNDDPGTP